MYRRPPLLRDLSPRQRELCVKDEPWTPLQINADGLPFKDTIDRPPPDANEVAVCRHWLRANMRPTRGVMSRVHSMDLAGAVERETGIWVSVGALIRAALELGYRARRVAPRSVNAHFNMAWRSRWTR